MLAVFAMENMRHSGVSVTFNRDVLARVPEEDI